MMHFFEMHQYPKVSENAKYTGIYRRICWAYYRCTYNGISRRKIKHGNNFRNQMNYNFRSSRWFIHDSGTGFVGPATPFFNQYQKCIIQTLGNVQCAEGKRALENLYFLWQTKWRNDSRTFCGGVTECLIFRKKHQKKTRSHRNDDMHPLYDWFWGSIKFTLDEKSIQY